MLRDFLGERFEEKVTREAFKRWFRVVLGEFGSFNAF
jgi:hypothetical protein